MYTRWLSDEAEKTRLSVFKCSPKNMKFIGLICKMTFGTIFQKA